MKKNVCIVVFLSSLILSCTTQNSYNNAEMENIDLNQQNEGRNRVDSAITIKVEPNAKNGSFASRKRKIKG